MKEIGIKEAMLLAFLSLNVWHDIWSRKVWLWSAWAFGIGGIVYGIWTGDISFMTVTALIPGGCFLILSKVTREAVGYGDGIVILVMGIYMGLWTAVSSLMIALVLAALWAMVLTALFKKKRKDNFAFLPFLLLGYLGGMWI
jgi:leader peptidase (prepilin peptidase)/N-methyltransferase